MALLCSHHAIDVLQRLDRDPKAFPVQDAVRLVQKSRNARLLKVDTAGWQAFQAITEWYDKYSHASALTVATQMMLDQIGDLILGGEFDPGKADEYRKELQLRVSSMTRLRELCAAVETHVRAAQAHGLFQ